MTQQITFGVRELTELGRVGGIDISPCGRWLVAAVARLDEKKSTYISDLWRVDLTEVGTPVQLTRGGSDDRAPRFRRDGSIGFLSNRSPGEKPDEGDHERAQVWLLPAWGGEARPLTHEPLGVTGFQFAAQADVMVATVEQLPGVPSSEQRRVLEEQRKYGPSGLLYRKTPVRYWDSWLPPTTLHVVAYDGEGSTRRDLTPDLTQRELRDYEWDISPDGRKVVITWSLPSGDGFEDGRLLLLDTERGESNLVGEEDSTQWRFPVFSPDGCAMVALRHTRTLAEHGPKVLWYFDLQAGTRRPLTAEFDRWPHPWAFTRDGQEVLFTTDDWGYVPVFSVNIQSEKVRRLTASHQGGSHEQLRAHPDGKSVVGVCHSFLHPPEPFRMELGEEKGVELLANLSGFRPEQGRAIARVEDFHVRSEDGLPIQTFLVLPQHREGPAPTLFWVHGGPRSQWADAWHWRWNALVYAAAGYVVALPNPRGSTGAGQAFIEGVWGNQWGGSCYRDLMAVADDLARRPDLDGGRIACMGASFGGFMTNWIGVNTDRFRCLVSQAGVFSFESFHGVSDVPGWWALEMGGSPWTQDFDFHRYSPNRRMGAWVSPTLIIHGERDYRVPVGESLALFDALQVHKIPSELLIFPNENHWILKPRNVILWYDTKLDFLRRWLGPTSS